MILSCQNLSKTFGPKLLFSEISFGVEERDRLAIIGPNGSGKSSLLKILAGQLEPDEGQITANKGLRVTYVEQQSKFDPNDTVLAAFEKELAKYGAGQHDDLMSLANTSLGKLGFQDFTQPVSSLSGGWKKRLAFASALATEPELLLLDEPTNHLDLEGIEALEKVLKGANFAWVLVTHDRSFLENIAKRIVEINKVFKGGMFAARGSYEEFLVAKAEYVSGQLQHQESLANKVRREVEWLSHGPKARTTKQQARIQSAGELQKELAEVNARTKESKHQISFNASERKTKKLVSLKNVTKTYDQRRVIDDFSFTITQGLKLGLLGLNASGKTTLLKLIAGTLSPEEGQVERADQLRVVYFEQNRERLDPNITLKRTLAPETDSVVANDRAVHVVTWARKFGFTTDQLELPVSKLSGGEQARLLIAKLMLEPADVLLLDEPSNDLDIPTLEVLEESLEEFKGAVVLITHDRYMLDRVSSLLLALDGQGNVTEYADYYQWQLAQKAKASPEKKGADKKEPSPSAPTQQKALKKLSYKDQRDLDMMEANIAAAETRLETAQNSANDPKIVSSSIELQKAYKEVESAQAEVDRLYARWEELEALQNSLS